MYTIKANLTIAATIGFLACTDSSGPYGGAPRYAPAWPGGLSASTSLFYDWDAAPIAATAYYVTTPCEFCEPIQGIRSGYSGGLYGVEVTGDGVRDGTLSANIELLSEVEALGDGQYRYTWILSNLGSGAVSEFVGGAGPAFAVSASSPLLGTAGPDRLAGTADDLTAGQSTSTSLVSGPPGSLAWGGVLNPSTEMTAVMYAPLEAQGPITTGVIANPGAVLAGSGVTVTATVDDNATGGNLIAGAEYRYNGGSYAAMQAQDGVFDEANEPVTATIGGIAASGVYEVCVRGTDAQNNSGVEQCTSLVVYNPAAGFVTAGVWFTSPVGAYTADPQLTDRVTVNVVAKYARGATVPTGNTRLEIAGAGLNFTSLSYEWLVVAGARAQYMGVGAINGAGHYGFLLTAVDTDVLGAVGADRIRLKIWDRANGNTVVYDSQPGATNGSSPSTPVEGGSIVIHSR